MQPERHACRQKAPYTLPDWVLQPLMPLLALAVCTFLYSGSTRTKRPRLLLKELWSWARVKPWVFRGYNSQVDKAVCDVLLRCGMILQSLWSEEFGPVGADREDDLKEF